MPYHFWHSKLTDPPIHVPAIGPTVGIAGYVQRPGIYELSGELTLDQAIEVAGGFTPFTFTPRIQVERTVFSYNPQVVGRECSKLIYHLTMAFMIAFEKVECGF